MKAYYVLWQGYKKRGYLIVTSSNLFEKVIYSKLPTTFSTSVKISHDFTRAFIAL
jgi:hypothetical protein